MMQTETFIFFFRSHSPFSNWYIRNFEENGITFNCVEQYMMYGKAKFFGDEETAKKILEQTHPKEHKRLGRLVKNFDSTVWEAESKMIVRQGAYLKFSQNKDLLKILIETKGNTLVEASPFDAIWGIKLAADDPRALSRKTWKGENRLGEILTELRESFLRQKSNQ